MVDQAVMKCPNCGKLIRFPETKAGQRAKCPECSGLITLVNEVQQASPVLLAADNSSASSSVPFQGAAGEGFGLAADEKEIWKGTPSHITNITTYALCVLFSWLIFPIFIGIWKWLQLRCFQYTVTDQRIVVTTGVVSRRVEEVELYRVKDTALQQSVFERFFGLATIHLKTSDQSHPDLWINSIAANRAKELREEIRIATERLRERKRVSEVDYA